MRLRDKLLQSIVLITALALIETGYVAHCYAEENLTPATVAASNTLAITGPTGSISAGETVYLEIDGLTLDEIKAARAAHQFDLTLFPLNGARVHAAYDWLNDQLELAFTANEAGEYLIKLHLVREQKLEIAGIIVVVEGDNPDPFPHPIVQADLITIIEETDDRSLGMEGAKLALHLSQVQLYLKNIHFPYQILDDDQPAAITILKDLPPSLAESRPVLVASAQQKFLAADSFGGDVIKTIDILNKYIKPSQEGK